MSNLNNQTKKLSKVVIVSNSLHVSSGYAIQARALATYLKEDGYEVAAIANSGITDQAMLWHGFPVYPARPSASNPYRIDLIKDYCQHFGADLLISLYDVWTYPAQMRQVIDVPWCAWVPVDGVPFPERGIAPIKGAEWRLAMSQFGQKQLTAAGLSSEFVQLGVDCDVFKPGDQAEARRYLELPEDVYIAGVIAANKGYPCRKAWAEILMAFARFRSENPRSILYLHTTPRPYGAAEGVYIDKLMRKTGLPQTAVRITSEADMAMGIPPEDMARLYQAFDVLLSPSMSEGFGVPLIEAQACGVPVISTACTAMPENTVYGISVPPVQPFYIPQLDYFWYLPSVPGIVNAMNQIRQWDDERERLQAVHKIRQRFHWPDLYERKWKPMLSRIEGELW